MKNRKLKLTELGRISTSEYKSANKIPLVVVLDNLRSFNNVGSVFRTSDAFRIEKIYLCGYTPVPPHREITKTALGATESVDWEFRESALELCSELKSGGWKVLSIEQTENSMKLGEYSVDENAKYCLVFGNEVDGVQQEIVDLSDSVIEVPQIGTKHSLNVSVCFGIVMWEFFGVLARKLNS